MKKVFAPVFVVALTIGSMAAASGAALNDAGAGMAALQSGDNDGAIALLTRALAEGLKGDDRELAYATRGKAYLNRGDYPSAISDLDRARQMKPDDTDAQGDLITAICKVQPANMIANRSAGSYANEIGGAIARGIFGGLVQNIQQQYGGATPGLPSVPGQSGPGC